MVLLSNFFNGNLTLPQSEVYAQLVPVSEKQVKALTENKRKRQAVFSLDGNHPIIFLIKL